MISRCLLFVKSSITDWAELVRDAKELLDHLAFLLGYFLTRISGEYPTKLLQSFSSGIVHGIT